MDWSALYEHVKEQGRQARIAEREKQRDTKRALNRENQAEKAKLPKRKCGARTRRGTQCIRKALANGRCPNHGGLSTGPKTEAGKKRIARAQKKRWAAWASSRKLERVSE
jgi:hypothetical protein